MAAAWQPTRLAPRGRMNIRLDSLRLRGQEGITDMRRRSPRIEHEGWLGDLGKEKLNLNLNLRPSKQTPEPLPKPNVHRALLWIALFVLFLIVVTVLELAAR